MKKLLILLTILFIIIAFACSKEHNPPTLNAFKGIYSPDSLVATHNKTPDVIDVTWQMTKIENVIDFVVSVSDSNVFDLGITKDFQAHTEKDSSGIVVNDTTFSFVYNSKDLNPAQATGNYKAYGDSLILYFTVSALYDTLLALYDEDKDGNYIMFIGPRAVIDSALIYRKED